MEWPISWKDVKEATESSFEILNLGDYGINLVSLMNNGGGSAEVPGTQIFEDVRSILDHGKIVVLAEPALHNIMIVPGTILVRVEANIKGFIGGSFTGQQEINGVAKVINGLVAIDENGNGTTTVRLRILAL